MAWASFTYHNLRWTRLRQISRYNHEYATPHWKRLVCRGGADELQLTYALQILWTASMPCVKWSLLLYYIKLFPLRQFRIAAWSIGIFLAAWLVGCEIAIIFQCSPLQFAWNRTIANGHCIDVTKFYIAATVLNMATNLITLALPLPIIWGLQIDTHKKVALSVAFTIGGL